MEKEQRLTAFIKNTKTLLRLYRVSQKALADGIGVCQQSISKYLNRQVIPSEEIMQRIAIYFGQSLEDMTK